MAFQGRIWVLRKPEARSALALLFLTCLSLSAASLEDAAATRDPWEWPFSRDSIWNMPLGADAQYLPANLAPAGHIGCDIEWHIRVNKGDPVYPVLSPSSWGKRWPGDKELGTLQFPEDLIIPDADPPHTPNACAAFLMPDGRTLRQLEPACRVEQGKHIVGWLHGEDQDLYGMGIKGTHYGSGLSAFGGSIRKGELTRKQPIRHALKINIWGKKYLYYGEDRKGFRWPADRSDSYAKDNYGGKNPAMVMGTLLAVPPGLSAEALGVKTAVGKKIFQALQDYGAYIADDSAWDAHDLSVERGVPEEVKAKYGYAMTGYDGPFWEDMNKIVTVLAYVDNNSESNVGGGGTPRKALAPRLHAPERK
jgi:hypothetical protein